MTAPDDINALAGEFVLGTLVADERAAVDARRQREPVLDAAIRDWERRLSPLDKETPPLTPPADLLARIERQIDAIGDAAAARTEPPVVVSGGTVIEIADLRRRLTRWRRGAIAASALAASLLVAIGLRESIWRHPQQSYVAVFAKDDVLPSFYLTIDLATRELTIRPVGAERQPGKTYQLWIASDQLGPAPRSLGLLDEGQAPISKSLASYDPALLQRATFGVSLEPAGGSPTGRPSPGALHAKLLPVAN